VVPPFGRITAIASQRRLTSTVFGNPEGQRGRPQQEQPRGGVGDGGGRNVTNRPRIDLGGHYTQDYVSEVLIRESIATISWAPITLTFLPCHGHGLAPLFHESDASAQQYGALTDNVRMQDPGTPCPGTRSVTDPGSTLLLVGIGLAGLGAWRKRLLWGKPASTARSAGPRRTGLVRCPRPARRSSK